VASAIEPLLAGRLPDDLLGLLPRGWQVLGGVVVVKLHPRLEAHKCEIADALLELYPRCSAVVRVAGVGGECRHPVAELLRGDGARTVHAENGVCYSLDALRTMFSAGNHAERLRMAGVGCGDVVVDLFAGVGQLCLPVAVHGGARRVHACELDANTFSHLLRGIRLNGVQEIVEPLVGDCHEVAPRGVADRIIMGYVHTTHEYLDVAMGSLKPQGGVVHYHETAPCALVPERPLRRLEEAAARGGRRVEVLGWHRVKKYSPGVEHVVVDARFGPV